jgi:hypothetical protein
VVVALWEAFKKATAFLKNSGKGIPAAIFEKYSHPKTTVYTQAMVIHEIVGPFQFL